MPKTATPEADAPTAAEAAQAEADSNWSDYEAHVDPIREQLRDRIAALEGVTGLPPSPGADRLIDDVIAAAVDNCGALVDANASRDQARAAEEHRDELRAAEPEPEVPKEPPFLASPDLDYVREWLKEANDADVAAALDELDDRSDRRRWAVRFAQWIRVDGNLAGVVLAVNRTLADTEDLRAEDEPGALPEDADATPLPDPAGQPPTEPPPDPNTEPQPGDVPEPKPGTPDEGAGSHDDTEPQDPEETQP